MLPESFQRRYAAVLPHWLARKHPLDALLTVEAGYRTMQPLGWLELCRLLAQLPPERSVSMDPQERWLQDLRMALQALSGPDDTLPGWFSQDDSPWAIRAQAMALVACGLVAPPTHALLSPLECRLLSRWVAGTPLRPADAPALEMVVLLVNPRAHGNEAGRLAWLQLWRLDGEPPLGECLVRAPQAQTLWLDHDFEAGLDKVRRLLRAAVSPQAPAVAWALQPLPMRHDDQSPPLPWGTRELRGASLSVALAVGSLHLLSQHVLPNCGVGRSWLHRVQPQALAISAQFEGDAPPSPNPLQWPLAPIEELTDKLHAFAGHMAHPEAHKNRQHPTSQVWVAQGTRWRGDHVQPHEATTLQHLLEEATGRQTDGLPPASQALLQAVLAAQGDAMDELTQLQPRAADAAKLPELDDHLVGAQRQAPYQPLPPHTHAALEQHLLRRLAQWTGGDHLQFQQGGGPVNIMGAPVRLRDEFCPIAIDRSLDHPKAQALRRQGASEDDIRRAFQAQSLQHLLHNPGFGQPVAWVLRADPAAGKTTLLAEHELRACWRALHRFACHGQWGEVALWVPLRQLKPLGPDGRLRDAREVLGEWVATHAPAFGAAGAAPVEPNNSNPVWGQHWQAVFEGPLAGQAGLRVRVLLDGVNELSCSPLQRQTLLQQLLDETWQAGRSDRLTPVFTVRTLERSFSLLSQGLADLLPWDEQRRNAYIDERLGAESEQAKQLKAAIAQDPETQDARRFYANPGMLALVCNLLRRGWISAPTSNRAQLFACTLWMRLFDEQARTQGHQEPLAELLDRDRELAPLNQMPGRLDQQHWHLPQRPGPLLEALRNLAHRMQWPPAITRPDGTRFNPDPVMGMAEDDLLDQGLITQRMLQAAEALHLLVREEAPDPVCNGATLTTWRWAHQRWLEFFAAYGLTPDAPPEDLAVPPGPDLEQMYQDFLERQRAAAERDGDDEDDYADADELLGEDSFTLPTAPLNAHEEVVAMAVQLRGRAVQWVQLLLERGNPELAARVALENWAPFGERRDHPQDGWWPEGSEYDERERLVMTGDGEALTYRRTHRLLNQVRAALLVRMNDPAVHISSRIRSGFLLGDLGGDGRFQICGQALILKDEHWQRVPAKGDTVSLQMGDLEGASNQGKADGALLQVDKLPAFEMAGLLTTQAQMRCFLHSGAADDLCWWPGAAGNWRRDNPNRQPLSTTEAHWNNGSQPFRGNFWYAQTYVLWESAQRQTVSAGEPTSTTGWNGPVHMPTEAQWEAAVRCAQPMGAERWRFGHTPGLQAMGSQGFEDVRPWHFNHDHLFGRSTPVGVFIDCAVGSEPEPRRRKLRDMAGNLWEWTSSVYTERLCVPQVLTAGDGSVGRVLRGGNYDAQARMCTGGTRVTNADSLGNINFGFRLGREVAV